MLILMLALIAAEPDDPRAKAAEAQGRTCAEAIFKEDFEALLDLTHPKIVAAGGGREAMMGRLRDVMAGMKKDGLAFESCKVQAPSTFAQAKDGLFCIVPLSLRMKVKGRTIATTSALLGVSTDGGKTWKFVDISPGEEQIRKLLPEIPREVKFPKTSSAVTEAEAP